MIWVYAAVSRKAKDTAAVPIRFVQRNASSSVVTEAPRAHPLRQLMSRINPFVTAMDFLEFTSANLDLTGNPTGSSSPTAAASCASSGRSAQIW